MIDEHAPAPVDQLATYHRNPRRGNVAAIAASLARLGQYRPIVVNRGTTTGRPNEVLAGNHTLIAARELGWEQVDAVWVDVDDEHAARIVAADNKTADLGGYDTAALLDLLSTLPDLEGTGYDDHDLQALLADVRANGGGPVQLTDPDETPDPPADPVSREGDVWQLGPHLLVVGDAAKGDVWGRLLADGAAPQMVWTDPPYGVDYQAGLTPEKAKKMRRRTDGLEVRNDGSDGLEGILDGAFTHVVDHAAAGAPVYVASPPGPLMGLFGTVLAAHGLWRQTLVWAKDTMVLGHSDYHYRHEIIYLGYTPATEGMGRLGRGGVGWYGDNAQTSVLEVPRPKASRDHPTMKPVDLIARCLGNSCPPGGIVADPFAGSGATMIACHQVGASARLIELDPRYADVICRRWQEHAGELPRSQGGDEVDFTAAREGAA